MPQPPFVCVAPFVVNSPVGNYAQARRADFPIRLDFALAEIQAGWKICLDVHLKTDLERQQFGGKTGTMKLDVVVCVR